MLAFVVPATATATEFYYLLEGDRNVKKNVVYDGNINIVIIDCQDQNNQDPIGCIIAANKSLEEKKMAILKKMAKK